MSVHNIGNPHIVQWMSWKIFMIYEQYLLYLPSIVKIHDGITFEFNVGHVEHTSVILREETAWHAFLFYLYVHKKPAASFAKQKLHIAKIRINISCLYLISSIIE